MKRILAVALCALFLRSSLVRAEPVANPIYGKVTAINDATQTIKFAFRKPKIVKIKDGNETISVIEQGPEVIRTATFSSRTQFVKEERGLPTNKITVGDALTYISVKGSGLGFETIAIAPIAASVNPLVFNLNSVPPRNFLGGSDAVTVEQHANGLTVTVTKPEKVKFTRSTEVTSSYVVAGRSILVYPPKKAGSNIEEKIEAVRVVLSD